MDQELRRKMLSSAVFYQKKTRINENEKEKLKKKTVEKSREKNTFRDDISNLGMQ